MNPEPASILLIRLKGIGEVVMSLSVVEQLRRRWPGARIDFVVEAPNEQLLQADPRIGKVYLFDKKRWRKEGGVRCAASFLRFLRDLRRERYDLAIDLHGVPRSQWLARAAVANQRLARKSGYVSDRFFTDPIDFRQPGRHNLELLNEFPRRLGIADPPPAPQVSIAPEARQSAQDWLQQRQMIGAPIIGLHPGAVSRDPWPPEEYIRLGRLLTEKASAKAVVTAGPEEAELARRIAGEIGPGRAEAAVFGNLLELAALLEACSVYIAGDTGPMHLAAAVGTPVVAIFIGLSDPVRSGPYGDRHFVFHEFEGTGREPFCPHRRYRGAIQANEVFEKVVEVLNQRQSAPVNQAVGK